MHFELKTSTWKPATDSFTGSHWYHLGTGVHFMRTWFSFKWSKDATSIFALTVFWCLFYLNWFEFSSKCLLAIFLPNLWQISSILGSNLLSFAKSLFRILPSLSSFWTSSSNGWPYNCFSFSLSIFSS